MALHTGLVDAYWQAGGWNAWRFLEDDFKVLRAAGFRFRDGSLDEYAEVVRSVAAQFADHVTRVAAANSSELIVVYGRGHWSMNAAALAADKLAIPLYVIERGILPDTYIVDIEVPFTAPNSRFREAWNTFRLVEGKLPPRRRELSISRRSLYEKSLPISHDDSPAEFAEEIIIGQCLFDYNCLGVPFSNAREFIDLVITSTGRPLGGSVAYRPHPLSPEQYPGRRIETRWGNVMVDRSKSWQHWSSQTRVHTWNSTLGLEARLVFNANVQILDPSCHYLWTIGSEEVERQLYIEFLNSCSVFQ